MKLNEIKWIFYLNTHVSHKKLHCGGSRYISILCPFIYFIYNSFAQYSSADLIRIELAHSFIWTPYNMQVNSCICTFCSLFGSCDAIQCKQREEFFFFLNELSVKAKNDSFKSVSFISTTLKLSLMHINIIIKCVIRM